MSEICYGILLGMYVLWNLYCSMDGPIYQPDYSCGPMMIYCLAYCELLLFSLVGLTVCSCSRIIQIYVCRLIGRDELLIV